MSERKAIIMLLERLDQLAPMGYTVGLHIRFATPLIYKSSYPSAWVDHYNSHSYYLRDPLVFWESVSKAPHGGVRSRCQIRSV